MNNFAVYVHSGHLSMNPSPGFIHLHSNKVCDCKLSKQTQRTCGMGTLLLGKRAACKKQEKTLDTKLYSLMCYCYEHLISLLLPLAASTMGLKSSET